MRFCLFTGDILIGFKQHIFIIPSEKGNKQTRGNCAMQKIARDFANDVVSLPVVYPVKDGLSSVFGSDPLEDEAFETGKTIPCLLRIQILVLCPRTPWYERKKRL